MTQTTTFLPGAADGPRLPAPLSVPTAIEARRSIRKYADLPVAESDLARILELAGRAPSSNNIQPWRFVVVRDPALKAQLREAAYNQAQVEAAPVLIVAYTDMRDTIDHLEDIVHPGVPAEVRRATVERMRGFLGGKSEAELNAFGDGQTFIAVAYLSLAAQSLGYATSLMGGFVPEQVKAILDLPAHVSVPALIALGVADEEGFTAHRHPLSRIVREVREG